MAERLIGAQLMRDMANSAAAYLEQNKQILNDLNVFPVPDGDTGTNMLMTIVSSAREVNACKENATVGEIMKAMSNGALRGARGNSGVILSQLFRGFMQAIPAETVTIGSNEFASAMEAGVAAAAEIGYPVLVRPSFVLGGRAMQIVANEQQLRHYLRTAVEIDEDKWGGVTAGTQDKLELIGEVEKKYNTTELDVDSVRKL